MLFRFCSFLVTATATAVVLWALSASSEAPAGEMEQRAQYRPIQSISHSFGSKFMSGYFESQAGACFVVLMIGEKHDPDSDAAPLSAMRLRLPLDPGQVAGFDSEEGRSVNVTCGKGAETVTVDAGTRSKLVALQSVRLPRDVARSPAGE